MRIEQYRNKLEPEDFFIIGLIMAGNGNHASNNSESEQITKVIFNILKSFQVAKKIYDNKKLIMEANLSDEQRFDIRYSLLKNYRSQQALGQNTLSSFDPDFQPINSAESKSGGGILANMKKRPL